MILAAQRRKPPRIVGSIEIHRDGVVEQHYTSHEHESRVLQAPKKRKVLQANVVHGASSPAPSDGVRIAPKSEDPLQRRKRTAPDEEQPWLQRGIFKAGFSINSPRLRGAKLFTKGKVR